MLAFALAPGHKFMTRCQKKLFMDALPYDYSRATSFRVGSNHMTTSETVAITGAFSYTGKYITRRLLASENDARTLTGHTHLADWLK